MGKNEKLRRGYTTGATAAAAAKAATRLLFTSDADTGTDPVSLHLPWGAKSAREVFFLPVNPRKGLLWASCGVIKNGGDDPDVTDGMEIKAIVSKANGNAGHIEIDGGEGVGRVTRPGLAAPVGRAAINPAPLNMIRRSVAEALREVGAGETPVKVVISAPEGAERAKRTMNERLGVVGGISILGTTGIVIPMSTSAWTATIDSCLDVALAAGSRQALLAFGRTSERAGQSLYPALAGNAAVLMGDYVGYALEAAAERDMDVVLVGQFAKFCKVAAGNFETHVRDSTLDLGLLERLMLACDFPPEEAARALEANTARMVFNELHAEGDQGLFKMLTFEVAHKAADRIKGRVAVEAVLFGYNGELLARERVGRLEQIR